MTVPDETSPTVGELPILTLAQENLDLELDGASQKLPRTRAARQSEIVDFVGLTKADNVDRLLHGVSLSQEVLAGWGTRLDTPPFSAPRHSISRIAPRELCTTE